MPKRKTYKKKRTPLKRRTYKRKRTYKKKITGPFRRYVQRDPLPTAYRCKLTYTHTSGLSSGSYGLLGTEQVFRLNSLYDPDFTGAGHQPYGFDQMTTLYSTYQVYGVKVQVTCTDPTIDSTYVAACFQPSTSTATLTGKDQDAIREQPMSITRMINTSGSQKLSFSQYFPIYKLEGLSRVQYAASLDDFSSNVTTSPVITPWFRIAVGNLRGNEAASCMCVLTFTYYCAFRHRKTQTQS